MKYDRKSVNYEINLVALHEMEELVPMTKRERNAIRKWARKGNDIETNPWNFKALDGWPMNYLQAFRLQYGYSSGPWDNWKDADSDPLWDDVLEMYITEDADN